MVLDDLAVAALAKNNTVETLAQTNKQITETIIMVFKKNEKLLLIIDMLMKLLGRNKEHRGVNEVEKYGGYCWTHGYKVVHGHMSKTCISKVAEHKDNVTQKNTMGESMANKPNSAK